ncbi:Pectin lyase fold/virulence factor [Penicillium malachiteum]|uniref:Pectin lyase fold/virulence factor n=1 Tax=Penicillium malachiteum TaxID=1324776 RepID=A0AAD6HM39_9EURO|nr:Pectin lyase fold/virulence factor [Penicillium malachiteum]
MAGESVQPTPDPVVTPSTTPSVEPTPPPVAAVPNSTTPSTTSISVPSSTPTPSSSTSTSSTSTSTIIILPSSNPVVEPSPSSTPVTPSTSSSAQPSSTPVKSPSQDVSSVPVPPSTTQETPNTTPSPVSTSTTPSGSAFVPATKTCPGVARQSSDIYWLDDQDHNQGGAGYAPYASGTKVYPVYRNVMDYNVVNDGSGDQTANIQHAIDDDGNGGSRKGSGTTRYPAEVFLPGGTYTLGSTLYLTVGTIIIGDPRNPPVIRASPNFQGQFLIMGYDKHNGNPETSFMILMKNIILDTTAIPVNNKITALQWGVAQGSGLTNIEIRMPTNSKGHTGIDINAGSTIAVTDVKIIGGATGIINSNQQVNFKNIQFLGCGTAFDAKGGWTVLLQGARFESCGTGINMTSNGLGSLVLLDSTVTNSGPAVRFHDSSHDTGSQNSQLLIQNLAHDGTNPIAVDSEGNTRLAATAHVDTWLWGTLVEGEYEQGATHNTQRPGTLLVNDKFFTKSQPTYNEYTAADVVNVKTVSGFPVKGDGATDDTKSLNAILKQNAEDCKITYIPYGVYRVSDTLFIPVGSRIVGEAWSVISGYGNAFKDIENPKAVVKIGNRGDVGLIEIQDMRFSVAEILPGAKVVEINAAGYSPGDVGIWNSVVLVGGTAETSIANVCSSQDPKDCMAAFMVMHLTETSSAYIENFWGWTADHNLDSTSLLTIVSTGRGILVESTKGTWLTGTGSEHHWLYNYNFHNAANVFAGLLQSESPYMQGSGEYQNAPAPWTVEPSLGDPDFTWCGATDQKCRTALATNVDGGSNIALYNSAAWAFFDGYWNGLYNEPCSGKCQTNMMRVTAAPQNLVWYSISTRMTDVMILDGKSNPREADHPGGWEGIIQAYGEFSS